MSAPSFMTTKVDLTTNRNIGRFGQKPVLIGIHTMEVPEGLQVAEAVARNFKNPKVLASAHMNCDPNSRVRSVRDEDTAWTLPGANSRSLNIEMAGYARQSKSDWEDETSINTMEIAAYTAAEWVVKFDIPVVHLTHDQIRAGKSGFVAHDDISKVYKKSTHWDPGPNFPWDYFLGRVKVYVKSLRSGGKETVSKVEKPSWNNFGFNQAYISAIQTDLKKLKYYDGEIDGINGPVSQAAIRKFQKDNNLEVDAIPGPDTKKAIAAKLNPKPAAKPAAANITRLQRAVRADEDNIWGDDTTKRLEAVRSASTRNGRKFPHGVAYTQGVVGTSKDGVWGSNSEKAHDSTVASIQKALLVLGFYSGRIDGVWGSNTEKAYQAAKKKLAD